MKKTALAVSALFVLFVFGCATIMGSRTHLLPISSTPSDASVIITDEKGAEVFKGATPTNVTLEKSTGKYWGGKDYTVVISKQGFETQTIPVKSGPNGWYIAGNLVFGGLIGWFIVDPLNGSMYNLSPEAISATMSTKAGHNNTATDGSIVIALIQDVPAELLPKLQRIQ